MGLADATLKQFAPFEHQITDWGQNDGKTDASDYDGNNDRGGIGPNLKICRKPMFSSIDNAQAKGNRQNLQKGFFEVNHILLYHDLISKSRSKSNVRN